MFVVDGVRAGLLRRGQEDQCLP